ncbi:hypothetical protein VMCG_06160 [Cytospora schulzeri]|uniref:Zn(2)-C6 fungal-type domain-containing protein n=1 Tax=Cytospora schulzeri TaxID=448051 RepID=A0A423W985_9PEZI|nr:hypothetical protein VMCG_06160 [Valsa malicola]
MATGPGPAYGKFRLKDSESDSSNPRPRKRNRKTLSCVQCHRSKVKCDRESPCDRCSKAGRTDECTYGLEAPGPNGQDGPGRELSSQLNGMYYASSIHMNSGLTNWATLMEELGDVKRYVFDQDARFHKTYSRITAIKDLYPTPSSYNFPFSDNHLDTSTLAQGAILEHLPPRTLVLDLVDNYMATYEKSHRLLHPAQFQRELLDFYAAPEDAPANWVAQLLMMLALSTKSAPQRLVDMLEKSTRDSISRNFLQWAEAFLRRSPYVNLPDLCTVRTLCMMAIAKGLDVDTPAHSRGLWGLVGFVVRLAMTMVLHRDPSSYSEIPAYVAEMRRRVWSTVMFLDLDAAIESGLPPSVRPGDSDTAIPLNVNDAQLSTSPSQVQTNSTLMALSQPRSNWTDSSFQIRLAESYPIVSKVLSIVNSTKPDMDSQTVEECDRKLRDILRETNGVFAHLLSVLPDTEKVLVLQQTMFEVFIRRILLALHHACVRDAHRYQADFSVAMLHIIIGLRKNAFPEAGVPTDNAQHQQQVPRVQARETTLTALRASFDILEASMGRSFHIFRMYFGLTLSIAAFEASERGEPLPEAMQEAAERIIEVAKRQRGLTDHNGS